MRLFRLLALLFALFLGFVALLADTGRVGEVFGFLYAYPHGDKLGHFGLYGTAALLANLGFAPRRVTPLRLLLPSLVIAAAALLEELSQLAVASRSPDLIDLGAGWLGIYLFGELGAFLKNRLARKQSAVISDSPRSPQP